MNTAQRVLERIRNTETNFESEYTTPNTSDYAIMSVDEDRLFNDLTQEQRLAYSNTSDKYPVLNIWKNTWMYITELSTWVLVAQTNTWRAELSWNPDFVRVGDEYLLDVENCSIYKLVTSM